MKMFEKSSIPGPFDPNSVSRSLMKPKINAPDAPRMAVVQFAEL